MTAMALQALAPYQERTEVKEAIDRAVSCLKEEMRDDFGYGTSESTAQVLLALSCLGMIRLLQKWDLVYQTLI